MTNFFSKFFYKSIKRDVFDNKDDQNRRSNLRCFSLISYQTFGRKRTTRRTKEETYILFKERAREYFAPSLIPVAWPNIRSQDAEFLFFRQIFHFERAVANEDADDGEPRGRRLTIDKGWQKAEMRNANGIPFSPLSSFTVEPDVVREKDEEGGPVFAQS